MKIWGLGYTGFGATASGLRFRGLGRDHRLQRSESAQLGLLHHSGCIYDIAGTHCKIDAMDRFYSFVKTSDLIKGLENGLLHYLANQPRLPHSVCQLMVVASIDPAPRCPPSRVTAP